MSSKGMKLSHGRYMDYNSFISVSRMGIRDSIRRRRVSVLSNSDEDAPGVGKPVACLSVDNVREADPVSTVQSQYFPFREL